MAEAEKEQIRETGIMAGLTHGEIRDFIDEEFKAALMGPREDLFDNMCKVRWLVGHAIMYAHSAGITFVHLNRTEMGSLND